LNRDLGSALRDPPRRVDAVEPEHHDVHEHDLGPEVQGEVDGVAAVVCLGDHDEARVLQARAHVRPERGVVVGDDDPRRRGAQRCSRWQAHASSIGARAPGLQRRRELPSS
jgi:hypothetical protein